MSKTKIKRGLTHQLSHKYIEASQLFNPAAKKGLKVVMVYVEGYEDIAFWREILGKYESEKLKFEINVPTRSDLAKGKKVLLSMVQNLGSSLIVCMDSDFDYLFDGKTDQSKLMLSSPYILHTYTYAIENHLCYAPSLKSVAVKATKNDHDIFDFQKFLESYSHIIFPLFLWYAYSALNSEQHIFVLANFKNFVRLNFIDIRDNGEHTIEWLKRGVAKKVAALEEQYPDKIEGVKEFGKSIVSKGVTRQNCYQYMQGHTLFDNVLVVLRGVCEYLKESKLAQIRNSSRRGVALENEISNYKNSLRGVEDSLKDNTNFRASEPYKLLEADIKKLLELL